MSQRLVIWRRGCLSLLVAALAVLSAAGTALAQSSGDEQRAKEQFAAGQEAVKNGDLKRARTLFQSSYDLGHSAGPMLNLADCEERLDLLASARQHFRAAVPLLPKGDQRVAYAEQRAAALDPRVPLLRVNLAGELPAGARLLLDEEELPEAKRGTDLPLDAGSHTLAVIAPGHEDWSRAVNPVDSQRTVLVAEVGEPRSEPTDSAASGRPGQSSERSLREILAPPAERRDSWVLGLDATVFLWSYYNEWPSDQSRTAVMSGADLRVGYRFHGGRFWIAPELIAGGFGLIAGKFINYNGSPPGWMGRGGGGCRAGLWGLGGVFDLAAFGHGGGYYLDSSDFYGGGPWIDVGGALDVTITRRVSLGMHSSYTKVWAWGYIDLIGLGLHTNISL